MSRRQAIPSNWFIREADPLPPLFPDPVNGDHYYNKITDSLRVFVDGRWQDAVYPTENLTIATGEGLIGGGPIASAPTISLNTAWTDARYVNHDQFIVSTAAPSGTPAGGVGTVWVQY